MPTEISTLEHTRTRSERTRDLIERSALEVFAESGFDGGSTREIARRASVKQQLITYHYGTKLELWKAVADRVFAQLEERILGRLEWIDGVDERFTVKLLIRELMRFSAETPELARFMIQEGHQRSPRLTWLVQRHVRRLFEHINRRIAAAQAGKSFVAGDPELLAYLLVSASVVFSQRAEFELLTGSDPCTRDKADALSDLLCRILVLEEDSPA